MSEFPDVDALMARIRSLAGEHADARFGSSTSNPEVDHYEYDGIVRDVLTYIAANDLGVPGLLATELTKMPSPTNWGWYA